MDKELVGIKMSYFVFSYKGALFAIFSHLTIYVLWPVVRAHFNGLQIGTVYYLTKKHSVDAPGSVSAITGSIFACVLRASVLWFIAGTVE